tara:strand:- start:48 stop:593 length:546 start_codon:yes stop_codon:yes gene_type:complete
MYSQGWGVPDQKDPLVKVIEENQLKAKIASTNTNTDTNIDTATATDTNKVGGLKADWTDSEMSSATSALLNGPQTVTQLPTQSSSSAIGNFARSLSNFFGNPVGAKNKQLKAEDVQNDVDEIVSLFSKGYDQQTLITQLVAKDPRIVTKLNELHKQYLATPNQDYATNQLLFSVVAAANAI